MGGAHSQQMDELATETSFTVEDLERMRIRFSKLDTDGNGSISPDEFLTRAEIANNPLAKRVIDIFDADGGGDVDFKEFIMGLKVFTANTSREEKLKFAFKVYDIDKDGFISNGELWQVLKQMVGDNLSDQQLQQIVDKTIMEADKDGDGKVSFAEFCTMVESTNVQQNFTVDGF